MAVGLRIRNENNILQIDGQYQNLELKATGVVTMNTDDNNLGRYGIVYIPGGVSNPVLAIRAGNEGVWVLRWGADHFRVYVGNRVDNKQATFYLFGEPSQASPAGGVGLIVRNENTGQIVYNSNKKYFRVLQAVVGGVSPTQSIPVYFPGKVVALVQNLRCWERKLTVAGSQQQAIFVIAISSGTMRTPDASTAVIDFRQHISHTGFGYTQPTTDGLYECNYMVVDVTGY